METSQVLALTGVIASVAAGITCIYLGNRFAAYDPNALRRHRERYDSIGALFRGEAIVKHDYVPDNTVEAGITYDYGSRRIIPNGRLSDDVVKSFLGT